MNNFIRISQVIETVVLCLLLLSCTHSSDLALPGKLVYSISGFDENKGIYRINPDGTSQVKLSSDVSYNASPSWSPDGKQIIFISYRVGQNDSYEILYITNADGTNIHSVNENEVNVIQATWSPDGNEIAYTQGLGVGGGIFFTRLDGTTSRPMIPSQKEKEKGGVVFCNSPSWSPDGVYLALHCFTLGPANSQIYKIKLDGSAFLCLTCDVRYLEQFSDPHWSPDGLLLGFVGRNQVGERTYRYMFYVMDSDGKDQRPLFAAQFSNVILDWAWSPDGQWIVVVEQGSSTLFFYEVNGNRSFQIDLPGNPLSVDWGK